MGRIKVETEVRRKQIAEVSLRLIADHGLEGLSIAAIARHLGLVPSAIYRHFKCKNEIIRAALESFSIKTTENLDSAKSESHHSIDLLETFLFKQIAMIREIRAMPRIIFASKLYLDPLTGHSIDSHRYIKRNLDKISDVIKTGQKKKEIRCDVNAETIALLILGIIMPAMIFWHVSDGRFDVTQHAKKSWPLIKELLTHELK